jgi:hypothetical protein
MDRLLFGLIAGSSLTWVFVSLRRDGYWRELNAPRRRGSNPPPRGRKPAPPAWPPAPPHGGRQVGDLLKPQFPLPGEIIEDF